MWLAVHARQISALASKSPSGSGTRRLG
jgi:hypothetical protein